MGPQVVTVHDDQVWMKKCIIGLEIGSIIYVDYQVCNGNDHLMLL